MIKVTYSEFLKSSLSLIYKKGRLVGYFRGLSEFVMSLVGWWIALNAIVLSHAHLASCTPTVVVSTLIKYPVVDLVESVLVWSY